MSAERADYTAVSGAETHGETPEVRRAAGWGVRHVQALLLFASLVIGLIMRAHLSVTLVAMTGRGQHNSSICSPRQHLNPESDATSPATEDCITQERSRWDVYRTYNWSKPKQEMILFAFFVGYTGMMLPMGLIAQKYGGKLPVCFALAVNGVLSILTPWLPVFGGWAAVCGGRLLQGATQAAFFPSVHMLLGRWAPVAERGRLTTYVYTGSTLGTVLAFQAAGFFAGSRLFGWPATFWSCGVVSLICCALLFYFGSASPRDHPSITAEELAYITKGGSADGGAKKRRTPWRHILTSRAVWGLVAAHCGSTMGYLLVFTQIPLYLNRVLGVDIKTNGVLSSVPYMAMYVITLLSGYLSDLVVNKSLMSVLNVRRIANSIGLMVSGLFLVGFSFVPDAPTAVTLLVLCLGLHSGVHVGFHINHIDLSPNFAGPLMAMGNMIGNLSGLGVPVLVSGVVGDDVRNQSRWQILFILFAALQGLSNFIFVICVQGSVQKWNLYGDLEKADNTQEEHCAAAELKGILAKKTITK